MEPEPHPENDVNTPSPALPAAPMPGGAEFAPTPDWAQNSYIQIDDLLFKFDRQTPVKYIADSLRNGRYRPGDPIAPLFTALTQTGWTFWRERVVAIWALGRAQLTVEERDSASGMLQAILEAKTGQLSPWRRIWRGLRWGYGIALPISFLFSLRVNSQYDPWFWIFLQMLVVLGTMASLGTVPIQMLFGKARTEHQDRVRQAAAETLGRLGVIESVGALAGTLFDASPLVRESSMHALGDLLPKISEDQYGLFGEQTMKNLGRALTHPNLNLVTKVLDALAKVGTSHAIPYVELVAKKGRTTMLQDKALEVLLRLDSRKKRVEEASVLMRPSSSLTAPTGQLLRPAYQSGETEPLQLLRATDIPSQNE